MRDLSDYVQVHERIGQFWEKFPWGRIETDVEFPDENTVRCEARVYRSVGTDGTSEREAAAIGHAEERRDAGPVNRTSAVENAETSAVGRALAIMGFSIHKGIASREEVEIAQRKAKAQNGVQKPAQGLPERYVDWLRLSIRSYDQNELADEGDWLAVVGAAKTPQEKKALVERLEAALTDLGGNPKLVRERWERAQAKKEKQGA